MAITYFNLTDGSLEFHENKLVISDKAKRDRTLLYVLIFSCTPYPILTAIKGFRHNDYDDFYFGLTLTFIWFLIIFIRRNDFFKVNNEYLLTDISHVKFSMNKINGELIAKLFTKNNRQRKIKIVQEDNQDFKLKNLFLEPL